MALNFEKANERIQEWTIQTRTELKEQIRSEGILHRNNSRSPVAAVNALKTSLKRTDGLTSRISFKFPKHMIYVHKGVGKDTPIEKAGTTNRKAKPWFNPVIDERIDQLADIVVEEIGSAIINNLKIK
jgi:hypothetical protein